MHIWTQARLWPALINVLEEGSGDQTAKRGRFLYVYLWEGGVWGGSKIDGMVRVGQNRIYAPYMTVYLVIFLPKTLHITVYIGSGQPYLYTHKNAHARHRKVEGIWSLHI